ncbi:hypothetical protein [Vibrio aquimaris]|uniref:Uncharacterized protein n=1 Tax=Vibrio aquimaris TaxID=2587862 RepID=A0A5P9CRE4_9VIBR|nr:hypothetical protein [Vibrio aquimaris]QFT28835.1 hypothetical protein FIV01_20750 [Vibrio aquimaris]
MSFLKTELQQWLYYCAVVALAASAKYLKNLKDDEPIPPRKFIAELFFSLCVSQLIWWAGALKGLAYGEIVVVGTGFALGVVYFAKFTLSSPKTMK